MKILLVLSLLGNLGMGAYLYGLRKDWKMKESYDKIKNLLRKKKED